MVKRRELDGGAMGFQKISAIVKGLKRGKAPGPDRIINEVLWWE